MNTPTPSIIKKLNALFAVPGLALILAGGAYTVYIHADDVLYRKYAIPMVLAGFIFMTIGSSIRGIYFFKNMNNKPH